MEWALPGNDGRPLSNDRVCLVHLLLHWNITRLLNLSVPGTHYETVTRLAHSLRRLALMTDYVMALAEVISSAVPSSPECDYYALRYKCKLQLNDRDVYQLYRPSRTTRMT